MKTCTYVFLSKRFFKFLLSSLSPGWKIVPKRWTNVTEVAWTSLLDFLVRGTFVLKDFFLQSLPWLEWSKSRYSQKKNLQWFLDLTITGFLAPFFNFALKQLHLMLTLNAVMQQLFAKYTKYNSCKTLTFSIQIFFLTVWVHVGKASLWEKDQSSNKGNKWVMSC